MTPIDHKDGAPVFDGAQFDIGGLHTAIITGEIAIPCWLQFGGMSTRITSENKLLIAKGLFIAMEIQMANCS